MPSITPAGSAGAVPSVAWVLIVVAAVLVAAALGRHTAKDRWAELSHRFRSTPAGGFFFGAPPAPVKPAESVDGVEQAPGPHSDNEMERVSLDLYEDPADPLA